MLVSNAQMYSPYYMYALLRESVAALTRKYTEIQRITYAAKARHSKMVCRLLLVFLFRCGVRQRFVGPQGCRPSYVTRWIQLHGTPLFGYICSTAWWIIFNSWQMKYHSIVKIIQSLRLQMFEDSKIAGWFFKRRLQCIFFCFIIVRKMNPIINRLLLFFNWIKRIG